MKANTRAIVSLGCLVLLVASGCVTRSSVKLTAVGDKKEFTISKTVIGLGVGMCGIGRADDNFKITVVGRRGEWRDSEIGIWDMNQNGDFPCKGTFDVDEAKRRITINLTMPNGKAFWLNGTFSYSGQD